MKDYKGLIEKYRSIARRWENGEQILLSGELRVQDTLQESADAIEEILKERDAAVIHGRWIPTDMGGGEPDEAYTCSVCSEPWYLTSGTPEENNMNYCPNCGARMDLK